MTEKSEKRIDGVRSFIIPKGMRSNAQTIRPSPEPRAHNVHLQNGEKKLGRRKWWGK